MSIKRRFKIKGTVYHGTISKIDKIDLRRGKGYKDFGKGFYLAYKKEQAVKMMNKKEREEKKRNRKGTIQKYLYTFETNSEVLSGLNIKVFEYADMEWLDFILNCRESCGTPHMYDIVIGPTADDDTSFCINLYMEGTYGPVGSIQAKSTLLNNLEVENYGTQMFIGTQRGLSILKLNKEERF